MAMAVVDIRPLLEGMEYKDSTNSASSAVLRYHVASDDVKDGPLTMGNDPRVPRKFIPYRLGNDFNEDLILNDRSWRPLGAKKNRGWAKVWELTCTYAPRTFSTNDPGDDPDHPQPPSETDSFSFASTWEVLKVPLTRDMDGKQVCNSAGEDFSPPYETSKRIKINRLTRRENIDPQQKADLFSYTVNQYPIWGKPEGTWLLEILVSLRPESERAWWSVDYNMRYNEEGWDPQLLDQGYHYRDGFALIPIVDSEGASVTTPRALEGHGLELKEDDNPLAEPKPRVWLTFKEFERRDFAMLNLPHWMV